MEAQEVSEGQYLLILEFMESHGDIGRPQPRQDNPGVEDLWQELTDKLNAVGPVNKSIDEWKKVWAEWKSRTIEKALNILGIDCGSNNEVDIIALVARVLANNGNIDDISVTADAMPSTSTETGTILLVREEQPSTSRQPPAAPARAQRPRRPFAASARRRVPPTAPLLTLTATMRRHGALPPRMRRTERLASMTRVAMLFADMEKRRIKLEKMKLRNEARKIEMQQRRNMLLGRLGDVAECMLKCLKIYMQKNPLQ